LPGFVDQYVLWSAAILVVTERVLTNPLFVLSKRVNVANEQKRVCEHAFRQKPDRDNNLLAFIDHDVDL